MRTKLLLLLPVVVLVAGVYGGSQWWRVWRFAQSTDDAYVASDISLISPKIEGYIKEVRVRRQQHVTAGQVLFVIDDSDFAAKVAQAKAVVATEEATVASFDTRHDYQNAMINQAAAAVEAAKAETNRADLDQKRYVSLVTSEVATKQRFETAQADATKAAANLLQGPGRSAGRESSSSPSSTCKSAKKRLGCSRPARHCNSLRTTSTTR